jgi:hypothetical protein
VFVASVREKSGWYSKRGAHASMGRERRLLGRISWESRRVRMRDRNTVYAEEVEAESVDKERTGLIVDAGH